MSVLIYTSTVFSFIIIFLSLLCYRRLAIDLLFVYLLMCLIVGVYSFYLSLNGLNNLKFLHFFTLSEFVLISLWYNSFMKNLMFLNLIQKSLIGVSTIIIILNTIYIQPINTFNTYAKALSSLLLILNPILYYLDKTSVNELMDIPNWMSFINAAVVLYFSGSLFIFMTSSYFSFNISEYNKIPWVINAMLYFLFQLLINIGLWRRKSLLSY